MGKQGQSRATSTNKEYGRRGKYAKGNQGGTPGGASAAAQGKAEERAWGRQAQFKDASQNFDYFGPSYR